MSKTAKVPESIRMLPSIDQVLRHPKLAELHGLMGIKRLTSTARVVIADMRSALLTEGERETNPPHTADSLLTESLSRIIESCYRERASGIRRVINATGVVLHTNLGRAPLSDAARNAINEAASRYCTLEYDTFTGDRGIRGVRVESLLQHLTGAEDALVVNNCAAAALLILSVLARDGETIVSRGELVEIGGDFRVPDVMANSGTKMVEVGTTNRTHLEDYRRGINASTRLIMRVHPSNYRIVGFSSSPSLSDLANLAHEHKLLLYEDAGAGQMTDLSSCGVVDETPVEQLIADGADIISFSGDKLLGSAQAGLIVGRQSVVSRLRKHPLYRALRSDKLRLAALEATLESHLKKTRTEEIPTLRMLATSEEEIETRARRIMAALSQRAPKLNFECLISKSAVGGGAGPTANLPTRVIAVSHPEYSAQQLEKLLRNSSPPVVTRIAEDKVLLDLRTVFPDEEPILIDALARLI